MLVLVTPLRQWHVLCTEQLWQHRSKEYSIVIAQESMEIIPVQLADFKAGAALRSALSPGLSWVVNMPWVPGQCGSWVMASEMPSPSPGTCGCYPTCQRGLCRCDKLRIWRDYPGPSAIMRTCVRGRQELRQEVGGSDRSKRVAVMWERVTSQGTHVASRSQKSKETGSPQGFPEGTGPANSLTLAQRDWLGTSDLQTCKRYICILSCQWIFADSLRQQ